MEPTPARPVAAALRLLLPLAAVLAVIAAVLGTIAGAGWWLARTEGGTRWLLSQLPGVTVEGWRGALLDERFAADRVRVEWGAATPRAAVEISGLAAEGLRWSWQPRAGAWVGLDAARLAARSVAVDTGPPSGQPPQVPPTLALPARVRVADVDIGALVVNAGVPLSQLRGTLALGDGERHRAERLQARRERLVLAGDASIAAAAPFDLAATLRLRPDDDSFDATLDARGPLERIALAATLQGRAQRGRSAPAADLRAVVRPFAPWPLAELRGRTEALDLSALASTLPQTRLAGVVDVQTSAKDAPIGAAVALTNGLPGRWNEGRLPVGRLVVALQASVAQRERVELKAFDLQLADATGPAGQVRGQGAWTSHALALETTLDGVRPQRLDARAAAMQLTGPLGFTLRGLPSPAPGAAPPPPWSLALQASLNGRLDAAPQPVQVALQALADAGGAEVRELRAQSGSAVAQLKASARREGAGGWRVASTGSLADFDPLPWWPGESGSAWRQGGHRVSADRKSVV